MTIPKKYIHDRVILLLLVVNTILAALGIIMILLNLGGTPANGYIVEYRANLGLSAFKTGSVSTFIGFILFAVFSTAFNAYLSIRVFHVRRALSVGALAMSLLLMVLFIVVSNTLLLNNR